MEWIKMAYNDMPLGSIFRYAKVVKAPQDPEDFWYALKLKEQILGLSKGWEYPVVYLDSIHQPPDFVDMLKLSSDGINLPSNSILRLAQFMIEDSLDSPDLLQTGERHD